MHALNSPSSRPGIHSAYAAPCMIKLLIGTAQMGPASPAGEAGPARSTTYDSTVNRDRTYGPCLARGRGSAPTQHHV